MTEFQYYINDQNEEYYIPVNQDCSKCTEEADDDKCLLFGTKSKCKQYLEDEGW